MSFVGLYMRLLSQADGFQILFFRSLSLCLIVLMHFTDTFHDIFHDCSRMNTFILTECQFLYSRRQL